MPQDNDTGLVEPDIVINGRALTFAECMTVRVAVSSFRIWLTDSENREGLGEPLAGVYDQRAAAVEQTMLRGPRRGASDQRELVTIARGAWHMLQSLLAVREGIPDDSIRSMAAALDKAIVKAEGPQMTQTGEDVTPDYRSHLRRRLMETGVPTSLHHGLTEYFAARRPVGSFLTAVLSNDLSNACIRADPDNRFYLVEIARFLTFYVPSTAWGSESAVEAWLADTSSVPEPFE